MPRRTSSKPPVANRSSRLDLPTPLSPTSRICRAGGGETGVAAPTQWPGCSVLGAPQQRKLRWRQAAGRRRRHPARTAAAGSPRAAAAPASVIDRRQSHLEGVVRLGLQARLRHTCGAAAASLWGCDLACGLAWRWLMFAKQNQNPAAAPSPARRTFIMKGPALAPLHLGRPAVPFLHL